MNKMKYRGVSIPTYAKSDEIYDLLERAINVFYTGEVQHEQWSRDLALLGLRGATEWHKLQSNEDRNERIKIQHKSIETFGVELKQELIQKPKTISTIEEYYREYTEWEIKVYKELTRVVNELNDRDYVEESKDIEVALGDVRKEIILAREKMQTLEQVQYDMSYIKLEDKKLAKKLKKIECKCIEVIKKEKYKEREE